MEGINGEEFSLSCFAACLLVLFVRLFVVWSLFFGFASPNTCCLCKNAQTTTKLAAGRVAETANQKARDKATRLPAHFIGCPRGRERGIRPQSLALKLMQNTVQFLHTFDCSVDQIPLRKYSVAFGGVPYSTLTLLHPSSYIS